MADAPLTCRSCHRPLRDPASRARRYGPKCWRDRQPPRMTAAAPTTIRAPRTGQVPGQLEIDQEDAADG